MIKATAGGGGRGMRVAHNEEELRKIFLQLNQKPKMLLAIQVFI